MKEANRATFTKIDLLLKPISRRASVSPSGVSDKMEELEILLWQMEESLCSPAKKKEWVFMFLEMKKAWTHDVLYSISKN